MYTNTMQEDNIDGSKSKIDDILQVMNGMKTRDLDLFIMIRMLECRHHGSKTGWRLGLKFRYYSSLCRIVSSPRETKR